MFRRAASAALALLILAGCAQHVTPPARIVDAVTVYIADHGRHAGLVLPAGGGGTTEWFWGDWHYFALRERSLGSGLRALFASPQSTLGRLDITSADAAVVLRATRAAALIPLRVERRAAERLHAALAVRHARRRVTETVHPSGARFVYDDEPYGLLQNSNHKVCEWLGALGASVSCNGIGANFRVYGPARRA